MNLDQETFVLQFGRQIDSTRNNEGWYSGSVLAYVKKITEQLPEETFLGEMCSGVGRSKIEEIFCQFTVGVPYDSSSWNSDEVLFRLEVVIEGKVVASAERIMSLHVTSWLSFHKVSLSLFEIMAFNTPDEAHEKILSVSVKSLIDEVLSRCKSELLLTLDRSAKAFIITGTEVFLSTERKSF